MISNSVITCPKCGYQAAEEMPTDACQIVYECRGCASQLKPKPGDCCGPEEENIRQGEG